MEIRSLVLGLGMLVKDERGDTAPLRGSMRVRRPRVCAQRGRRAGEGRGFKFPFAQTTRGQFGYAVGRTQHFHAECACRIGWQGQGHAAQSPIRVRMPHETQRQRKAAALPATAVLKISRSSVLSSWVVLMFSDVVVYDSVRLGRQ